MVHYFVLSLFAVELSRGYSFVFSTKKRVNHGWVAYGWTVLTVVITPPSI